MYLKIELNSENSPFKDGNAAAEVHAIVIKELIDIADGKCNYEKILRDVTGNSVGKIVFILEKDEK